MIDFFYDPDGRPYAMKYNGLVLYYVLNQQGDVVRLIDSEGVNYGSYKYDAWGNILQKADTKYINNNPLRYRGYVYDTETELYYCQSRYYDPKIGRFLNADALVSTGQGILGNNMFAYCNNNPVCKSDHTGKIPAVIVVPVIIGIINDTINSIYYELSDGESEVTPDSYRRKFVSRWERLDYTKQKTGEPHYNTNAWRFHSEYSMHEYGWYLTSWAYEKDVPLISWLAERFYSAEVKNESWDERWYVNVATVLWGLLGF